ncbi:MAG: glycoside hydrolase family 25 protein [Bacteroides sp.]|nr:glycoside hydrolase family 25 protein [Bacteroides sp.]
MAKKQSTPLKKKTIKPKKARVGKKKKKIAKKWEIPTWLYYVLMGVIVVLFSAVFYYFFIRPYAYRWKPCYGMKAYGICMPYGYQVHGIDISHYQGKIDWKMLTQTRQGQFPIHFVFMKSTEGGDFSDKNFVTNFDSAKAYGFIRGAYHFYNPKTDPIKQADFFINSVKLEAGDLPPVLDIEKKSRDMKILQKDLKVWLRKVENHYGVKPIIYASYKFKTRYLNDSVFNSYPYWIAHYYVDSVKYEGDWKFWQHTDVGTLPGISEQVDLNIFNGSLSDLDSLLIK